MPWRVLNVSSLACPENVRAAFDSVAEKLQPSSNPGCVDEASRELAAARAARDAMMQFLGVTLAFGRPCDSEDGAKTSAADPWAHLEAVGGTQQPLLLGSWRRIRRWARVGWDRLKTAVVKHSPWLVVAGAMLIQALAFLGVV